MSIPLRSHRSGGAILLALSGVLALAALSPASADVLVKQTTSSSGIMGMGAVEGSSIIVLSGGNQRTESRMSVQGLPVGMGGDQNSIDIIRMDKGVMWNIDEAQSQYTETSFAQMQQMMSSGFGAAGGSGGALESSGKSRKSDEADDMDLSFSIEETGSEKEINGFATRQSILRIEAESTNPDRPRNFTIVADLWLANDFPGQDELTAFQKNFAKHLGMDPKLSQGAGGMGTFLAAGMGKMTDELAKLDGYAILSIITLESSQLAGALGGGSGEMPDMSNMDMEKMQAAARAMQDGDMETAQRLMAEFQENLEKTQSEGSAGSSQASMSIVIRSEVTEIRTTDIPKVSFDIPEGFKKVDRQMPFQMGGSG